MPVKDGSAFTGWKLQGAEDTTATMFPTYPSADTTYVAVWAAGQVNLTYNPMGGTFAANEDGVRKGTAGASFTAPANPTRTGYTFGGWYTDADCTNGAPTDATLPTAANTVYYAKWTSIAITVTMNTNDGTDTTATYQGTYGATILYTTPEREGYTFQGWADSKTAATGNMFPTYPASDETLYAVWNAKNVTLGFDAAGGTFVTGESGSRTGTVNSNYTAPADPTRTGYTFEGWYSARTGGTKVELTGKLPTASTVLYAHWTANTIKATLDPNGGSINEETAAVTVSGSYGDTISYNMPTREGYTFQGWAEDKAAATGTMFPTYPASDTTLYAVWKASTVVVTFDPLDGSITSGSDSASGVPGTSYTVPTATRTGYTFDGWYMATNGSTKAEGLGTLPTGNATYYAHWLINTVTLTLDAGDGKFADQSTKVTMRGDYGTAAEYTAPTRTGYTFKGWKLATENDTEARRSLVFPAADTTYVAVWSANAVTVTFDPMGAP